MELAYGPHSLRWAERRGVTAIYIKDTALLLKNARFISLVGEYQSLRNPRDVSQTNTARCMIWPIQFDLLSLSILGCRYCKELADLYKLKLITFFSTRL